MIWKHGWIVLSLLLCHFTISTSVLFWRRRRRPRTQICTSPKTDCRWGKWSVWSECDAACGEYGSTTRHRAVKQNAVCGGKECAGNAKESKQCFTQCATVTTMHGWLETKTTPPHTTKPPSSHYHVQPTHTPLDERTDGNTSPHLGSTSVSLTTPASTLSTSPAPQHRHTTAQQSFVQTSPEVKLPTSTTDRSELTSKAAGTVPWTYHTSNNKDFTNPSTATAASELTTAESTQHETTPFRQTTETKSTPDVTTDFNAIKTSTEASDDTHIITFSKGDEHIVDEIEDSQTRPSSLLKTDDSKRRMTNNKIISEVHLDDKDESNVTEDDIEAENTERDTDGQTFLVWYAITCVVVLLLVIICAAVIALVKKVKKRQLYDVQAKCQAPDT